jgi:outer membrane protein assembly factor BamB
VVTKDAVYIGSGDGYLYSLDARTGKQRWKFYTGAPVVSRPAQAGKMIYVGSKDHSLYALQA